MPEPQPAPEPCEHRHELLESIQAVMIQILDLHQREIEAVKNGDIEEMTRFDHDLNKAREFERSLFERFISHTRSHGCCRK